MRGLPPRALATAVALLLAGCAGGSGGGLARPETDLYKIAAEQHGNLRAAERSGAFRGVLIDPDADFGSYTGILLDYTDVGYRKSMSRYRIPPGLEETLRQRMPLVIAKELTAEGDLTIASEPGPGVLLVRSGLVHILLKAPITTPNPRDRVRARAPWDLVLVFELRDTVTGDVVYWASARRRARNEPRTFDKGMFYFDMRDLVAFGTRELRRQLLELRPPEPDPADAGR